MNEQARYLFGGYSGQDRLNDLYQFRFDIHAWSAANQLLSEAHLLVACASSQTAVLLGSFLFFELCFYNFNLHISICLVSMNFMRGCNFGSRLEESFSSPYLLSWLATFVISAGVIAERWYHNVRVAAQVGMCTKIVYWRVSSREVSGWISIAASVSTHSMGRSEWI